MNIPDLINDFLVDVRNHDGFANDRNFDRVAAEVFKQKIKEVIEACAKIADVIDNDLSNQRGATTQAKRGIARTIGRQIRALAAPRESEQEKGD